MSPVDSGFPRDSGVKKRMLPSVTDVVRELARVVSADPAVLFKASRSVVGEELAKVKQGFEAAPLDVLVKRARLQLERDGEATPVSDAPPSMPIFPARPASGVPAKRPASDDPFQDVPSRADLNWEKEIPIQPEDAPFRSAILPIPRKARGPLEISQPIDAPAKAAPEPKPKPTPAPKPPPELELDFAPPSPPSAAPEPPKAKPKPTPPEPPPPEAVPEKPMPRPAVVSAPAIPLVNPRDPEVPETASRPAAAPPSVPKAPGEPLPVPPAGPERFLRAPTPPVGHEPAVTPRSETPPLGETLEDRDDTQPAMEEFRFKAAERPTPQPAPARSSRRGWIPALLGVLAIGAGLTWAVREGVFKGDILKSGLPAAGKKPDVAPPASAAPEPTVAPPAVVNPVAPPPKALPAPAKPAASAPPPGAAVPKGRAAVLLTSDWAGKPPVFVLHFSSTKDRESAAKEAQKLSAALGAPGHAVEVDLGEKGIWYRVVIGEFADVDAARAFRADLEAKKTPGMGFVYEMRGR